MGVDQLQAAQKPTDSNCQLDGSYFLININAVFDRATQENIGFYGTTKIAPRVPFLPTCHK